MPLLVTLPRMHWWQGPLVSLFSRPQTLYFHWQRHSSYVSSRRCFRGNVHKPAAFYNSDIYRHVRTFLDEHHVRDIVHCEERFPIFSLLLEKIGRRATSPIKPCLVHYHRGVLRLRQEWKMEEVGGELWDAVEASALKIGSPPHPSRDASSWNNVLDENGMRDVPRKKRLLRKSSSDVAEKSR